MPFVLMSEKACCLNYESFDGLMYPETCLNNMIYDYGEKTQLSEIDSHIKDEYEKL